MRVCKGVIQSERLLRRAARGGERFTRRKALPQRPAVISVRQAGMRSSTTGIPRDNLLEGIDSSPECLRPAFREEITPLVGRRERHHGWQRTQTGARGVGARGGVLPPFRSVVECSLDPGGRLRRSPTTRDNRCGHQQTEPSPGSSCYPTAHCLPTRLRHSSAQRSSEHPRSCREIGTPTCERVPESPGVG